MLFNVVAQLQLNFYSSEEIISNNGNNNGIHRNLYGICFILTDKKQTLIRSFMGAETKSQLFSDTGKSLWLWRRQFYSYMTRLISSHYPQERARERKAGERTTVYSWHNVSDSLACCYVLKERIKSRLNLFSISFQATSHHSVDYTSSSPITYILFASKNAFTFFFSSFYLSRLHR